tara:strand:+ start:1162 stop:2844 length:1683 start_codon:yes stop_codon:yes gene_type:complete
MASAELPQDIDHCHQLIEEQQATIDRLQSVTGETAARLAHFEALLAEHQETIVTQQQTIENLSADNKLLKRSLFGSRRERYDDPAQILLFDPASLVAKDLLVEERIKRRKKRTSKGRQPRVFPEFLPREEQRYSLNEEDIPSALRNHPNARRFFKKVGEQLELVPMQLKVVEQFQEVIAVDQPDETTSMVAARRPQSLIHSFAGTSLLSYLTVSRFADHLPYYRLEDILGRVGFRIDRSTQWRWMRGLADGLTPLVDLMWERVRQSQVIAMDETPVTELTGRGESIKGYLWAGVGDAQHPYDCFFYTSDRRSIGPETYLSGFAGHLLGDAYVAYERIGRLWPGVSKASCWVHARRKFEECHQVAPTHNTHTALAYFRQLFDLEDQSRENTDDDRLAWRQAKLKPVVDAFLQWLEQKRSQQLPKAKLLAAINYMLNRWESFTRFLESGNVPMDSNSAERAVKFPILGRKAWLFFGNRQAGEASAKLFTLTKTCNRLRIDPFAYLQDVYARLPTISDELPSLLPDRWIQEHPQHLIQERVQEALDRAQRMRERRAERRNKAG